MVLLLLATLLSYMLFYLKII